jgi:hypothetical protein
VRTGDLFTGRGGDGGCQVCAKVEELCLHASQALKYVVSGELSTNHPQAGIEFIDSAVRFDTWRIFIDPSSRK